MRMDPLPNRRQLQNIDTNIVADFGALYVYDESHKSTGIQYTNNIVYNNSGPNAQSDQTKAIYLDGSASNVLIRGNVCWQCGEFAWQIHGGNNNTIENNIFRISAASGPE